MKRKMFLDEEVVKYIFTGVHPVIARGEDGYVAYDFDTTYPKALAVFVPIEVEPSNYNHVFPKSFEDYFRDLDLEISRLSLLIERGNVFNRFARSEFVAGQFLRGIKGAYTVFRFDELKETEEKTDLLCRTRTENLSAEDLGEICAAANGFEPQRATTIDGTEYLYWGLPVQGLFNVHDESLDELIPMMLESLSR